MRASLDDAAALATPRAVFLSFMSRTRRRAGQAAAGLAALAAPCAPAASAQEAVEAGPQPPAAVCALTGDPKVLVEGQPMLRLGDVIHCPELRYDIVPNVRIGGQMAVRLSVEGRCAAGAAAKATMDGAPITRRGDVVCQ